jgi:hypothetical protein
MSLSRLQKAVHVAKDKENTFGGYNYRTAEGILAAAKAQMQDGESIVVSDQLQEVAGQIFVSATATVTFADGTSANATGHALHSLQKKGMDAAQITGSASSYARKYALSGLLALDDGSADPDGKDNREPAPRQIADDLKAGVDRQDTLENLGGYWKALQEDLLRLPEPMRNEVTAAKDKRKGELSQRDAA